MSACDSMSAFEAKLWKFQTRKLVAKLKRLVESEGFVFENFALVSGSAQVPMPGPRNSRHIAFFGRLELGAFKAGAPVIDDGHCGALFKVLDDDETHSWFPVGLSDMSQQCIVNWMKNEYRECIVCFADENEMNESGDAKWRLSICYCGAVMCFGCILDQITVCIDDSEVGELEFRCPNCRQIAMDAAVNLLKFQSTLLEHSSFRGFSGTQRALLKRYTGFDGTKKSLRVLRRKQRSLPKIMNRISTEMLKGGEISTRDLHCDWKSVWKLETKMFPKLKREMGVDCEATVVPLRAGNGCRNCGKEFWDAKAKKRAPKCTKCKRVTYCNAKCRKAHKKTHAPNCKKPGPRKPQKKQRAFVKRKPAENQKKAKVYCKPY